MKEKRREVKSRGELRRALEDDEEVRRKILVVSCPKDEDSWSRHFWKQVCLVDTSSTITGAVVVAAGTIVDALPQQLLLHGGSGSIFGSR